MYQPRLRAKPLLPQPKKKGPAGSAGLTAQKVLLNSTLPKIRMSSVAKTQ
jgi:hypothetical protein